MSEERAKEKYPPPFGSVGIFRICEHCNKEYRVPLNIIHNAGRHEAIHNFGPCPECGQRDDVWLRVTITPNQERAGASGGADGLSGEGE